MSDHSSGVIAGVVVCVCIGIVIGAATVGTLWALW